MKRTEVPSFTGDGEAAGALAPAEAPGLPNVRSPEWIECTEFVGADAKQVRVYFGSGAQVVLKTVPGCSSLKLAHALTQQSDLTSTHWMWMLDLKELHSCDIYLLGILLALGNYLRHRGGRLILYNLAEVPMPSLVEPFLRECEEVRIQFGASECAGWRFRVDAGVTGATFGRDRAPCGTAAGVRCLG